MWRHQCSKFKTWTINSVKFLTKVYEMKHLQLGLSPRAHTWFMVHFALKLPLLPGYHCYPVTAATWLPRFAVTWLSLSFILPGGLLLRARRTSPRVARVTEHGYRLVSALILVQSLSAWRKKRISSTTRKYPKSKVFSALNFGFLDFF